MDTQQHDHNWIPTDGVRHRARSSRTDKWTEIEIGNKGW